MGKKIYKAYRAMMMMMMMKPFFLISYAYYWYLTLSTLYFIFISIGIFFGHTNSLWFFFFKKNEWMISLISRLSFGWLFFYIHNAHTHTSEDLISKRENGRERKPEEKKTSPLNRKKDPPILRHFVQTQKIVRIAYPLRIYIGRNGW